MIHFSELDHIVFVNRFFVKRLNIRIKIKKQLITHFLWFFYIESFEIDRRFQIKKSNWVNIILDDFVLQSALILSSLFDSII
jgi:hypothetical protein